MMRYVLHIVISLCIILLLGCLAYLSLLLLLTLTGLLMGYVMLIGLFLAVVGLALLRRTLLFLRARHVALAQIVRVTITADGRTNYLLQFLAHTGQKILSETSLNDDTLWGRVRRQFLRLYAVSSMPGSRLYVAYDRQVPEKDPRRVSFVELWLGPLLLLWSALLCLLFGLVGWLS